MPDAATQMFDRVKANPLTDQSVRWRLAGIHAVLAGMKNGQWDTRSGLLTADATGNHLINASYEYGTTGWRVQGGVIFTVGTTSRFRRPLARVAYEGPTSDEGWYSSPVVAKAGQTWVAHGLARRQRRRRAGQRLDLGVQRPRAGDYRAELPVVLTASRSNTQSRQRSRIPP